MKSFTIILPVYNDWDSLKILLNKIEKSLKNSKHAFNIFLINDCSTEINKYKFNKKKFKKIYILNLKKNIGSQKAIATGLKYINKNKKKFNSKFIIMDSDGEDDPKKIIEIIDLLSKNEDVKLITLNRTLRKESIFFSILYEMYLFLTFLITFKYIRFGNFSYIDSTIMKKISDKKDLWLAYSATINKFIKNKKIISAPRKKRIKGKSKMSYFNLFKHGLNIQSVYKKNVLISYFFYSLILIFLTVFGLSKFITIILIIFFIFHLFLLVSSSREKIDGITFNQCLNNIKSFKIS